MTKPKAKAPKKEPVVVPEGFTDIKKFKPKFVKIGPISSVSEKLYTFLSGGESVRGIAQRYDSDIDAPNVKAKKGDIVYIDNDDTPIKNVTHFI